MRAAVDIEPADQWRVAALVDASGAASAAPPADTPRDSVLIRGDLRWVCVGAGLWHVLGTRAAVEGFDPSVARGADSVAALAELRLGIPAIRAAAADRYVPQMLNLDRLDALSFDKGCYPGQEVVARVQHLGSVKRRMRRYAAASAAPPAPGAEVASAAGQPAGEIVRAAPADGGFEALAVVDDAAAAAELFAAGVQLHEQPLP
jgi:folate-binding protein YgfZ